VFCRYCGQQVPHRPVDLQELLNRTANFLSDTDTALDAIEEYVKRWPDSPESRDIYLTNQCMRLYLFLLQISRSKFTGIYAEVKPLADSCAEGLPARLANGLMTSARVKDVTKRKGIIDILTPMQQVCAAILQSLYDAADKECQSLLVNGKSQAQIKGVSCDYATRDAEVHWTSFQKGEYEAALRGFTYLKELDPTVPFFHQALGSILFRQEKWLGALQEFVYGLSLAPGNVDLTALTLRCLCGLSLYPAALEIVRHQQKIGQDVQDPSIRGWGVLAKAVTSVLVTKILNCAPEDFSEKATDLIDEFDVPDRPWLTKPEESNERKDVFSNARIFISYRHSGGLNFAERVERALKASHPSMRVFRDETWITPGHDFEDQLREEIDTTDIFLALIDRNWAQRFQEPGDVLRREIARALKHGRKIIPILLNKARMPKEIDLPDELKEFRRLDAIRLTESGFSDCLRLLDVEMSRLLEENEHEQQVVFKQIDEVLELKERDPEAADRIIRRWADVVPKYIPGKSVHGEGVPKENMEILGLWECTATILNVRLKLTFMTEETDQGTPFAGEYCITPVGIMSFWKIKKEEIKGTWEPVWDTDSNLLLGIFLDGLKSGAPFKLMIPIHRRLGDGFVGTDQQGTTYSSRNVQPKRKGL
jgi:tetratricopeptide (TPR) repeat protein